MPATNLSAQFLDTVGMEFESEALLKGRLLDYLAMTIGKFYNNNLPFVVTRDASAESIVDLVSMYNSRKRLSIYTHNRIYQTHVRAENRQAYGYELITNPMNLEELQPLIYRLTNSMEKLGDFVTDRCAVHVHIGFAHNLRMMKKLLAVCLAIDPLLFRLGGMGRLQRGYSNLSAYARPLMNSAAVPVINRGIDRDRARVRLTVNNDGDLIPTNESAPTPPEDFSERGVRNSYVQIINPLKALEAKTTDQFWANFGVFPSVVGLSKYHPVRYSGCNFYAIAMHGTMEFRHFNQSMDPALLFTLAKFLRAVVELSTVLTKGDLVEFSPQNPNNEISMNSAEELMSLLENYFKIKDIEASPTRDEINLLLETIEKSSFKPIPETPVLSHNNEFSVPSSLVGDLIPVKSPLSPKHVDIHTIKYSSILGGAS